MLVWQFLFLLRCRLFTNIIKSVIIAFGDSGETIENFGGNSSTGLSSRMIQLSGITWMLIHNAVFGLGASCHTRGKLSYRINGIWQVRDTIDNGYVGYFVEEGLLGGIACFSLFYSLLKSSWKRATFKNSRNMNNSFFLCFVSYVAVMESVLAQKDIYVDILARDDGSTDKTLEILKKYDRVKVYGGNNLKPAKSFLDLIWKSDINYDYYALCDQDDVWKEEKIISAVKCIENIDKPALYSSAVEVVDKDLTFIRKSFTDNTFKNPLYDILTYGTPGCTFVFNKALMEKLKQYKPSVISMHDSWISFVCLAVNGFFYSDQNAYIMYRQHDANVLGAQRHSLKDTLRGIVKNKNVLRSDMAKEILKGYSEMMPEKTKEAFITFAEYKENLKYKLKILMLPYNKKKTTKRTFEKVKLRIVFNTI